MYVGQSTRPPGRRVEEHRRLMPWGHAILPGRNGYTIVRRVESSGNPTIDAILLDLAEAQEIRRLNPTDNLNRPDPGVFEARLAAARAALAAEAPWGPDPFGAGHPVGTSQVAPRRRRGAGPSRARGGRGQVAPRDPLMVLKVVGFIALAMPCGALAVWLAAALPYPEAPWVAAPIAAVLGPAWIAKAVRDSWGKPRRRRRRRWR
jgi:hypothetical protein